MGKQYNIPDLKAPRLYRKRKNIVNDELIKKFKLKYPIYKDITKAEFNKIIKAFNENVCKEIIENRDGVKLPESIGTIFVGSCDPPKSYNLNVSLLIKEGITSFNKNWETDGHIAKIFFTSYTEKYKYRFRSLWTFKAHRSLKRSLSKEFVKNWTMYHKINSSRKVSEQLYLKRK